MRIFVLLASAAALFFADQTSKSWLARTAAALRPTPGGLLTYRLNTRTRLARRHPNAVRAEMAVMVGGILALASVVPWARWPLVPVGLGLALGGAVANARDLRCHGGIADIIDVGWWPVFNLADAGIVVGMLVAGAGMAVAW